MELICKLCDFDKYHLWYYYYIRQEFIHCYLLRVKLTEKQANSVNEDLIFLEKDLGVTKEKLLNVI